MKNSTPEVHLPLSKSIWNRLQILAEVYPSRVDASDWPSALSFEDLTGFETGADSLVPEDVRALARVIEAVRRSVATGNEQDVNVGPAGTAWRFGLALAAATPGARVVLDGDERLKNRPMLALLEALRELGAEVEGDAPPHRCRGRRLRGGPCTLDASASSQHLSALLLIAPLMEKPLEVRLKGPVVSEPYALMTAALLEEMGARVKKSPSCWIVEAQPNNEVFEGRQRIPCDPDWSAAAVHGAAVAVSGKSVFQRDLNPQSLQGDRRVVSFLRDLGVEVRTESEGMFFEKVTPANQSSSRPIDPSSTAENPIAPVQWDFSALPDTAQPLLTAAFIQGRSGSASGLATLSGKEIDRIAGLMEIAEFLGVEVSFQSPILKFAPGPQFWMNAARSQAIPSTQECPRVVSAHGDHRQAFSWALVGWVVPVELNDPECVKKSYPDFWRQFQTHVGR